MVTDAQTLMLLQVGNRLMEADPLLGFRFSSEAQRLVCRYLSEAEVYHRAGNSGGKTANGAAIGVALARGLESLDGEALPRLGVPNVGWVLTQTYKQQSESSQKAYLHWIGNHPHHIAYVVGNTKGYIEIIHVSTPKCKHGMGAHCVGCSRIVFHCEESKSSIGGRIDWAHADEPPLESTWREIRMRRQAGKKFIRFITATPLEYERFAWLQEEFDEACCAYKSPSLTGGEPFYGEPKHRRAEIRSTIYDNLALSLDDIAEFETDMRGDPFADARKRGDYVDLAGKCPFPIDLIQRVWMPRCRSGQKEIVIVQDEAPMDSLQQFVSVGMEVETWFHAEPRERYIIVADPSHGIADKMHDPAGVLVLSRISRRLVARYSGYGHPYAVGSLCAILGKRYNRAMVDVDMTGGYGGPVMSALKASRYSNIFRDIDPDKPGQMQARFGFRISSSNKGEIIGAVQQAITEDSIVVPSREVLASLMNVTVDESGRLPRAGARKGRHDEDMICLGRGLYLMSAMPRAYERRIPSDNPLTTRSRPAPESQVVEKWQ